MSRLLTTCLLSIPLWGQSLVNTSCPNQGQAGSTVMCTIGLSLGAGVRIDSLTLAVTVMPNGAAPSLTSGPLIFADSISALFKTTGGTNNSIAVMWGWLTPALSGSPTLGSVAFTLPSSAVNGQAYTVNITGISASLGDNVVNLSASFGTTVGVTRPVLTLSPSSLSFSAVQGGTNPANQTVAVSNTGVGTLNWSTTAASIARPA